MEEVKSKETWMVSPAFFEGNIMRPPAGTLLPLPLFLLHMTRVGLATLKTEVHVFAAGEALGSHPSAGGDTTVKSLWHKGFLSHRPANDVQVNQDAGGEDGEIRIAGAKSRDSILQGQFLCYRKA